MGNIYAIVTAKCKPKGANAIHCPYQLLVVFIVVVVHPVTVQALGVMYNALNSPAVLTGWKVGEGDPCGESWKGITCEGSAVVSMYEIQMTLHN